MRKKLFSNATLPQNNYKGNEISGGFSDFCHIEQGICIIFFKKIQKCSGKILDCSSRKLEKENLTAIDPILFGKYEKIFSVERCPNGSTINVVTVSLLKPCRYA